ncbi:UMP kinase [Bacteroidota bacterium]
MTKYNRVLLKLSGESLMGSQNYGIEPQRIEEYANQIKELCELDVKVGVVIGGGNIFRGLSGTESGFDRINGDYMGMLATVINSLALQSALESIGIKARVLTAIKMEPIGEMYSKTKTLEALDNNTVVVFSAGTGNPFFTTDTASALRAVEMKADVLLKGTRVDGVYSSDPEKDPTALRFEELSFNEVIYKELKVMDQTAFTMCKENNQEIIVFDMNKPGNLKKVILGEQIGTLIRK